MLIWTNGGFYNSDTESVSKDDILLMIDQCAADMRDRFCKPTSPYEAASWALKLSEAAKFAQTKSPDDAPMLSAEAQWRNVTLEQLVARVDGNAAQLGALEAQIAGVCGRHRDAVRSMTDEQALAYDWRDGWPE